jgi:predicted transcriptional regulator
MRLGAGIVAAYVSRNAVSTDAVPDLIRTVHHALTQLTDAPAPAQLEERPKPAVPIGRSVQHDYIVCLEDGKKLKMLKRYLRSRYNMSPDDYRRRWGLQPDYPMVAPAYAARRSDFAKKIGLGRGVRRRK